MTRSKTRVLSRPSRIPWPGRSSVCPFKNSSRNTYCWKTTTCPKTSKKLSLHTSKPKKPREVCQIWFIQSHMLTFHLKMVPFTDKDKSVQDLQEGGNSSALMLDDIFFIVKKCVQRAVTCQSVDGVCAVVNNANSVLETDLCTLLQVRF